MLRDVCTSRNAPAIMDTAAATAPVAPASSTGALLVELAATPKTRPKIDTVPSSMPKTISPTDATSDCFTWPRIADHRLSGLASDAAMMVILPLVVRDRKLAQHLDRR